MKLFLLAFFVAAAVASPIPGNADNGNIDVIVNGVPDGESLDIGHLVDIYTQEKVNGELVAASNILHPFTAQGQAEIAAAAAAEAEAIAAQEKEEQDDQEIIPSNPDIPSIPQPIVLPDAVAPVVVEPTPEDIPEPVVNPEAVSPVVMPETVVPETGSPLVPESPEVVVPEIFVPIEDPQVIEPVPEPAPQAGEIFNDGAVSVTVNAEEPGLLSTLSSWFNMVVHYVTNGTVQSTQIV